MHNGRERNRLSLLAALAMWALLAGLIARDPPSNILSWDTFGYHLYLPATIIHGDPGISDPSWVAAAKETYQGTGTLYQISQLPNGRWVDKYPMGLAMLWSPFFLMAHAMAGFMDYPQDGFSAPYQWGLITAALLFMLAGLLLTRKVLLSCFSDDQTAASIVLLVLATNYLHQATQGTGMPHIFLFTLGAAVLHLTVLWCRDRRIRHALLLGVVLGLMVASRPTEIVWVLVPLSYGASLEQGWGPWLKALWSRRGQYMLMALASTAVCMPQLIYWKWMTGHWFYMSYNNPGEGFELIHPYIREVLFSFRKGWFLYTPVMLIATVGIAALWSKARDYRWPVLLFVVNNVYLVGSWSCWWYADSFGQRAFVQSYAIMIIPLAASIVWLVQRRSMWRLSGIAVLAACAVLNLFQTWQIDHGIIHTSRMTWPAYRSAWLSLSVPDGQDRLLLFGRSYDGENARPTGDRYQCARIAEWDLDSLARGGGMDADGPFTPAWRVRWSALTARDHVWLEVRGRVQRAHSEPPMVSIVTTMEHAGHSYGYQATDIAWSPDGSEWADFTAWYLTPEIRRPDDELIVYGWLRGDAPARLSKLDIFIHEPKS